MLFRSFHINCVDPGVVDSNMISMDRWYDPIANIFFRPLIKSPRAGACSTLKALTLKSSGNIVKSKSVKPIPYDMHDVDHGHLVEKTREYLISEGINIL